MLITRLNGSRAVIAASATGIGPRVYVGWIDGRPGTRCHLAPDTVDGLAGLLGRLDHAASAPHLRVVR